MIKLLFFFFLLLPKLSSASVKLYFDILGTSVHQGSLLKSKFKFTQDFGGSIQLKKIEGEQIDGTIYIYSLNPINGNSEETIINGDAIIIFLKKPETSFISKKLQGLDVEVSWSSVEVIPTEIPEKLIWGEFEIPQISRINKIIYPIILLILLIIYFIFLTQKKWKRIKKEKDNKKHFKNMIFEANSYSDVVKIWEKKYDLISFFPHLNPGFVKLEEVLFKYQFKPFRTNDEEQKVVLAYQEFVSSVKDGFNGV